MVYLPVRQFVRFLVFEDVEVVKDSLRFALFGNSEQRRITVLSSALLESSVLKCEQASRARSRPTLNSWYPDRTADTSTLIPQRY